MLTETLYSLLQFYDDKCNLDTRSVSFELFLYIFFLSWVRTKHSKDSKFENNINHIVCLKFIVGDGEFFT